MYNIFLTHLHNSWQSIQATWVLSYVYLCTYRCCIYASVNVLPTQAALSFKVWCAHWRLVVHAKRFSTFPLVAFFFTSEFRAFVSFVYSTIHTIRARATTNVRASCEKVCMKRTNRNPFAKFVQIHRNLSALHPWFHPYPFPNTRYFFMPLVLHMQIGIPAKLCKASGAYGIMLIRNSLLRDV